MEETMTKQTKQTKADAGNTAAGKVPMTQERASAIKSRTMKDKSTVSKEDFAARAESAVARNGKAGAGQ